MIYFPKTSRFIALTSRHQNPPKKPHSRSAIAFADVILSKSLVCDKSIVTVPVFRRFILLKYCSLNSGVVQT